MNPTGPLMLGLLLACADSPGPEGPGDGPAPVKDPASRSPAELALQADAVALVPSPAETRLALEHAGITGSLGAVAGARKIRVEGSDTDELAVRVGVVLADLILSVREAPQAAVVDRLGMIRDGMARLGAGPEGLATLDELVKGVGNGGMGRADLLRELDELSGVVVPRVEAEIGPWRMGLIQAGSWLEGAWLVSGAIAESGQAAEAAQLLRQPQVVRHFRTMLSGPEAQKAPAEVIGRLERTLARLDEITAGAVLGEAEVQAIHEATGDALSLLGEPGG